MIPFERTLKSKVSGFSKIKLSVTTQPIESIILTLKEPELRLSILFDNKVSFQIVTNGLIPPLK